MVDTTVVSFDERCHLCLNLNTGAFVRVNEKMCALWENTPVERVASVNPHHFDMQLRRRRVM